MNSYQKIKKKNQDLIKELMIVCCDSDSRNARLICEKYKTINKIETAIWFADYLKEEYGQFKGVGIVSKISSCA